MSTTGIHVAGSPTVSEREEVAGTYVVTASGFFETMGIALRAGRLFGPVDDAPGTAVIVSETFAGRFWPNASPIGQHIQVDDVWRDVVGVVADVRHRSVDEPTRTTFYLPAAQTANRLLDAVLVRTAGDPRDQIATVRRIVSQEDPTLAIARADRLSDLVDATLVAERFRTLLFAVFGGTAVLLAAIGTVGVATNAAARRKREWAIRMAVGARPATVIRVAMTGTLTVAIWGGVLGSASALMATRALRPFLYGISATDPTTYAIVLATIATVAIVATWIPARRAARVDLARLLGSD